LITLFFFALPVSAQDTIKVCMGSQEVFQATSKETGSTYEYYVEGGELFKQYNESFIAIEWGHVKDKFRLGVRETSVHGCEDPNWAYLIVDVVGDSAVFSQSTYSMCGGDGVYVEFDKSKFKSYEWDDKVNVDINTNYIGKAGRYTIRTIDQNECHLSSTIEVIQSPMPQVHLGADTMICTPGFRLYALGISGNSNETVYTWSTGESGVSAKFIDVDAHDQDQDQKYWVTADLNGCSASDTIVVLACRPEPVPEALKIPNTFTPNNDGENDEWNISALRDYPDCTVEVFDRWGRKVFTSTRGYTAPWNGRDAKGHYLPMETYYYIIQLNDGITKKPFLGTITIIR
jgi:gliding motility-associated-like protein